MPDFLTDLLRRGRRGAGDFLKGYLGGDTERETFPGVAGLAGGFSSLYESLLSPLRPLTPEIAPEFEEEPLEFSSPAAIDSPEVPIAPGVTAVGGRRAAPAPTTGKETLTPQETRDLIGEIRDMSTGLAEIRLPDGTQIKGITPDKMLPMMTQQGPPSAVPPRGGAQPEQPTAGGFLSQVGNFLGSPEFQYLAGRTAQAIVPQQTHGVNIAGGVGAQLGINRAYDEYTRRLASGESFEALEKDRTFTILPPELKSQALRDVLTTEREGVTREYTRALTEQAKAVARGQLTRADILKNRAIDDAVRLKVAEIGDNNWMNVGQGHVFNIDTGEIVKAYDYQTGGAGVGNLNASDYRLFNEYTTGVYLPLAMANKRREIVQSQGESAAQVVDLTRFFRNDDGSTNFQAIMQYLSDNQRTQFAKDLNQYTFNAAQGLPPTTTFLSQQAGIRTVVNPETGQTEHWRINPDGTATKVR